MTQLTHSSDPTFSAFLFFPSSRGGYAGIHLYFLPTTPCGRWQFAGLLVGTMAVEDMKPADCACGLRTYNSALLQFRKTTAKSNLQAETAINKHWEGLKGVWKRPNKAIHLLLISLDTEFVPPST